MRIKGLQVLYALAHAHAQDGKPQLVAYRNGDTALCGTVQLSHDHAVKAKRLVELACLLQAVLPGRRIYDEHDLDLHGSTFARDRHDLLELAHEVCAGMQAARGVDQDEVAASGLGAVDHVVANACRICPALALDDLHPAAAAPLVELLDRSRAKRVCTADERLASGCKTLVSELAHRRGLACTVDADKQNAHGLYAKRVALGHGKKVLDGVCQQVEHGISIRQGVARSGVAQTLDDLIGGLGAQIRQDQRLFQVLPKALVDLRAPLEEDVHVLCQAAPGFSEAFAKSHRLTHLPLR